MKWLVVALVALSASAQAQTWPAKPVKLIVSQAAGGAPDILARLIADGLSKRLGQQFVVENRPGSANMVGAQAAARSAPDGATFFFATAAALVTNQYTFKELPYDPVKDFDAVAMVGKAPFLVVAHPSVPAKNMAQLLALDKAEPGKLAFATDGPRNFTGMVAAWINRLAGARFVAVPYNAMPQGVQDTVAGRTQLAVLAIPIAGPFLKRGELRPLAITSATRAPGFEQIAPIADTLPGFDFVGWFAIVAPAGTPQKAIQVMNRAMDEVLRDPPLVSRTTSFGVYTEGAGTPQSTAQFIAAERERWGRLVREIGVQPE
jgi:tripartite-type tricarboxylate transporter receptor subunit TctC